MREIGVCVGFMNGSYRRTITETAARLGFSVTFHDSEQVLAGEIEQYEVLFGHPAPGLLKKADKLYKAGSGYKENVLRLEEAAKKLEEVEPEREREKLEEIMGDILISLSDIAGSCKIHQEQILTDRVEDVIERYEPVKNPDK